MVAKISSDSHINRLRIAALFHDIGKADYKNRLTQNKVFHNQGDGSVNFLESCGFRGHEYEKELIRSHHKRVQSDQTLRLADILSSMNRLEGGNTNRFIPYFPQISTKIAGNLSFYFNLGISSWIGIDAAYTRIRCNPWLDIIPADLNCSLESQSLRIHLLQTHFYVILLWNNPQLESKLIDKLKDTPIMEQDASQIYKELKPFGLEERIIAPLNRKVAWKMVEELK